MLTLDITGLLPEALHAILSRYCARFGRVRNILLTHYSHRDRLAIAEVDMASPSEASLLAAEVGHLHQGTKVVMTIAPQEDEYRVDADALWRFACASDLDQRVKAAGLVV